MWHYMEWKISHSAQFLGQKIWYFTLNCGLSKHLKEFCNFTMVAMVNKYQLWGGGQNFAFGGNWNMLLLFIVKILHSTEISSDPPWSSNQFETRISRGVGKLHYFIILAFAFCRCCMRCVSCSQLQWSRYSCDTAEFSFLNVAKLLSQGDAGAKTYTQKMLCSGCHKLPLLFWECLGNKSVGWFVMVAFPGKTQV